MRKGGFAELGLFIFQFSEEWRGREINSLGLVESGRGWARRCCCCWGSQNLSRKRRLMALEMLTPVLYLLQQLEQVGAPKLLCLQTQTSLAAGCSQQARCVLMPQLLSSGLMVLLSLPALHSLVTRSCSNPSEVAFQQAVNSDSSP